MEKKRVALYCRLAHHSQLDNSELEQQEQRLRVYATVQGYEIAGVIKDIGNGHTMDRPGIRELTSMAEQGEMDMVLAVDSGRYGRCPTHELTGFVNMLASKGVTTLTLDGNLSDLSDMLSAIWDVMLVKAGVAG